MQSVLMTGASGLVGSRFVEMFGDKYEIANMDLATGVDITNVESIKKFVSDHPASTLIHLAAFTDTGSAFADTGNKDGLCYKVNVLGTENIANVCKDSSIHLIHISTDFVFDGTKTTPYVETDPTSPIEWYGETKALAEKVVQDSGALSTIARIAYPYRANFEAKPDLIQKIRAGLASGKLYPQFADTLITPTFIDDIANAFDKLIELKTKGILHIVGSGSLSPFELAGKVASVYGFDPSIVKEGSLTEYQKTNPRPFARFAALSNAKASALGMKFLSVDEGLAELKKQQGL